MEAWLLARQGRKQGYNLLASVKPLCLLHTMVMALDTLSSIDCVSRLKPKDGNKVVCYHLRRMSGHTSAARTNAVHLDKLELAIDEQRSGSLVA